MRKIIAILLPDIQFSDKPVTEIDKDRVADAMFEARRNIQTEFDFEKFNRLDTNLQDRLISAERFQLSHVDGEDAQRFVSDLYAALQAMFRKKLADKLPPDIADSEFIERAKENARNAGYGELPDSLCTVKPRMIRQTLQGDDQSLGACAVAFLIVSDKDDLKAILDLQPPFISDINDIITRRGHGNELLPMPKKGDDGIMKIRKSAYSTIKTLLEV